MCYNLENNNKYIKLLNIFSGGRFICLDTNNKVEQIFTYLQSIKNMSDRRIRDINKYDEIFFQSNIENLKGVNLINDEEKDQWIEINNECSEIYNKFSKIYLKLQKNSENLEIVYGYGLVVVNVNDKKIIHPLFTTKMNLKFDDKNKIFSLKPYNNVTNVETDILNGLDYVDLEKLMKAKLELKSLGINTRNEGEIKNSLIKLKSILNLEDMNINYDKFNSLLDIEGDSIIRVYNEPVIIFRKVDTRLWNMELESMIKVIKEGYKIPKTVEALVTDEFIKEDSEVIEKWAEIGEDLLFPLPYNEDQKEIVKKLSENFGVVVQGPPGTGKSHTIVNLICHLLAHGKRVLVTSQTDRALKVLNNKIPKEIRSLCMSILGDDAKAMEELDEAVRRITENLSLDTGELKKQFKFLKYRLKECKANQNKFYDKLKEIEQDENANFNYDNKEYSLMDMAKFVRENEGTLDYIEDNITLHTKSPLSNSEFEEFLYLLEIYNLNNMKIYEECKNYLDKLPNEIELLEKIKKYNDINKDIYYHRKVVDNWSDKDITSYSNSHLLNLLDEGYSKLEEIEGTYFENIMKSYHGSPAVMNIWNGFVEYCKENLNNIYTLKGELNKHNIELPNNVEIVKFEHDFKTIDKVISEKGKIGPLFKLLHGDLKYIIDNLKVNHELIGNLKQVEIVNNYIKLNNLERDLKSYYNKTMKEYNGQVIQEDDDNYLVIIENTLEKLDKIKNWNTLYKDKILNLLKAKYFNREINFYDKESYKYIKDSLLSLKVLKDFKIISDELDNISKELYKYECFKQISYKINEYDYESIKDIFKTINYLKKNSKDIEKLIKFRNILNEDCPKLLKKILSQKNENLKDKFKNFQGAIKYKAFYDFLEKEHLSDIRTIERSIYEEKITENKLIKEIVSIQSWCGQIERTTEAQKRSLFTWMEAIKRIGKGTGSQAIKYRKIAQKEMEKCKDVIPVWIMPINRVIENLKVNENLFDVVIVDESSQSDITALTVLMRAERAVIVGDEKQISPEAIGKDSAMVEKLIQTHLKGIPNSEWFDLKTSLYNTALRVFPNRLVLKEHFRSVNEIIGFSNNMCYSNEIIPLRCGKNDNPLKNPIVTVKVEDGFRDEKKSINIKEAYAIVDKIVECCNNPEYDNMSMGVISLLGDEQAELIENRLIEKLGMEEIIKRNLVCGDAYSFQGDERDVMFLSFVISNNAKFGILSKNSDMRRFNVAASRARNQMWLFHSIDLEDLNPKCIRYKLLEYGMNYDKYCEDKVDEEKYIFTEFEEDVYNQLKNHNLQVTPKVHIGKYNIDFVVNGQEKIAIECVGAKREEKYSWEESFQRQHTLERVGWKFHKIRSSEFYLDKEKVIKTLCNNLNIKNL